MQKEQQSLISIVGQERLRDKGNGAIKTVGEFLQAVDGKEIKHPYLTSLQLVNMALTDPPPYELASGYLDYPVFTQRKDQWRIYGVPYSINSLGIFTTAASQMNDYERILLLVGPTGAGKSLITNIFIDALEKKASKLGPFYYIDSCPIRDHPFKILGPRGREKIFNDYGVIVEGGICPDCQEKFTDQLSDPESVLNIPVKTFEYSSKMGIGITRLDPKDTKPLEIESWKRINKIVFGSSRGLLIIDELGEMDPNFLRTNNDLFRGRNHKRGERMYILDTFIMGVTTVEELKNLQGSPLNMPIVERMGIVHIPYNTSITKEVEIYEQAIRPYVLVTKQHISRKTLEFLAEVAVRSRIKISPKIKDRYSTTTGTGQEFRKVLFKDASINDDEMCIRIKLALYDGLDFTGFTQQQHRKEIEKEGLTLHEGFEGISPPFMRGKLLPIVSESYVEAQRGYTAESEETCLSPISLYTQLEEMLGNTHEVFMKQKKDFKEHVDKSKKRYDEWLEEVVKESFQGQYGERVERLRKDYIDQCEFYLDKSKLARKNPLTGETEKVDIKFLKETEDAIFGRVLPDTEREEFRRAVLFNNRSILPKFNQGIENIVRSHSKTPEEILIADNRLPEQNDLYEEARGRLLKTYDFCPICVRESMWHVGKIIKARKGTK